MFRQIAFTLMILAGLGLAGCQTVEGAGEDIENAGEAVQKTVDG